MATDFRQTNTETNSDLPMIVALSSLIMMETNSSLLDTKCNVCYFIFGLKTGMIIVNNYYVIVIPRPEGTIYQMFRRKFFLFSLYLSKYMVLFSLHVTCIWKIKSYPQKNVTNK